MAQRARALASAAAAAVPRLTYYSAWFCPYAHRATIALSHHERSVKSDWVESLGWERRPTEDANTRAQGGEPAHENWYHWKSPGEPSPVPSSPLPPRARARAAAAAVSARACIRKNEAQARNADTRARTRTRPAAFATQICSRPIRRASFPRSSTRRDAPCTRAW